MSTESMDLARAAVARGVALLDEKVPGWWKVVNLDKLNMGSCTHCMLGQLFGHDIETAVGAKVAGLEINKEKARWTAWDYVGIDKNLLDTGFYRGLTALGVNGVYEGATAIGCNNSYKPFTYEELKCAWAEIIAERRATADADIDADTDLLGLPKNSGGPQCGPNGCSDG